MPLPTGDITWPPKPYDAAFAQMGTWRAWWTGDTAALEAAYAGDGARAYRPSQFSGGLVGAVARMFWGRPMDTNQASKRIHLPVARSLARVSSQLLFAQPPTFGVPGASGNEAAEGRVDAILNTPGMHSALLESAVLQAVDGGTWLRVAWDDRVRGQVWLDSVEADGAIPEWSWGELLAVTFFTRLTPPDSDKDGRFVWRHLERHERGRILHGLYRGSDDKLGRVVPLTDHPVTEPLAGLVDAESAIITDVDRLTAGYVPNRRPNSLWADVPGAKLLGESDFAGVEPLMDFIDETWSSLQRDVRLGKGRLIVPEYMLEILGRGQGAQFDTDREVFTPLNIPPSDASSREITPQQFEIRVQAHLDTANAAMRELLRTVGYSPITFGMPDEVAATATEVHAREKDTLQTRADKIRYWSTTLAPLATTAVLVDAVKFGTGATLSEDLEVSWPEGARDSLLTRAQAAQAMSLAQAASIETRVRVLNPEWDNDRVIEETGRIRDEQGMTVPDPIITA